MADECISTYNCQKHLTGIMAGPLYLLIVFALYGCSVEAGRTTLEMGVPLGSTVVADEISLSCSSTLPGWKTYKYRNIDTGYQRTRPGDLTLTFDPMSLNLEYAGEWFCIAENTDGQQTRRSNTRIYRIACSVNVGPTSIGCEVTATERPTLTARPSVGKNVAKSVRLSCHSSAPAPIMYNYKHRDSGQVLSRMGDLTLDFNPTNIATVSGVWHCTVSKDGWMSEDSNVRVLEIKSTPDMSLTCVEDRHRCHTQYMKKVCKGTCGLYFVKVKDVLPPVTCGDEPCGTGYCTNAPQPIGFECSCYGTGFEGPTCSDAGRTCADDPCTSSQTCKPWFNNFGYDCLDD